MLHGKSTEKVSFRRSGYRHHFAHCARYKIFLLLSFLAIFVGLSVKVVALSVSFQSSFNRRINKSSTQLPNMIWPFGGETTGGNTPTDSMSKAASEALGKPVEFVSSGGGGLSGGGGATTSTVVDKLTNTKYFVKMARNKYDMLYAEYLGVNEMHLTNTIKVPTPIACGKHSTTNQAFCIFEYLEFVGGSKGSQFQLGVELAKVSYFVTFSNAFMQGIVVSRNLTKNARFLATLFIYFHKLYK